jgi:hypothetical protein
VYRVNVLRACCLIVCSSLFSIPRISAQTAGVVREYVHLNGRTVALENPSGTLSASPNPIVSGSSTTLTYSATGVSSTQIWRNNTTLQCSGGTSGSCVATGVTNGTQFQLKDAASGLTLASTTVSVTVVTPGVGAYDDRDSRITYAGTWQTNTYSLLYSGTQSYSSTANSSASFTFNGTSVTYVYSMAANIGYANIYIDGSLVASNLDGYLASGTAWQKLWTSSTLAAGNHTIQVVATGNKNALATAANVTVDAFIVGTSHDDGTGFTYSGSGWTSNSDSDLWGGGQHFSDVSGDYATYTFSGSFVTYSFTYNYNIGIFNISVDGVSYGSIDAYLPAVAWQSGYTIGGLSAGTHTLKVTVSGTKNASATDTYVTVDRVITEQ